MIVPLKVRELCKGQKFGKKQKEAIRDGFIHWKGHSGLPEEKIRFYAKPEFSAEQMQTIRVGFLCGLTLLEAEKYALPAYSPEYMHRIFYLLTHDRLSYQLIDLMISENLTFDQMDAVSFAVRNYKHISIKQVEICVKGGLTRRN